MGVEDTGMNPDEFRRAAHDAVDWVADYLERVESLPVLSTVEPGAVRALLPAHPPEDGEPWDEILADLDRVVLPGITHWQSPNFFGYFPANASGPPIIGDLVSSGLGVQGMLWSTSPACTELETHVLDWLVELLGLPEHFRGNGVIQDSASSATLCAVLAARPRQPQHRSFEAPGLHRRTKRTPLSRRVCESPACAPTSSGSSTSTTSTRCSPTRSRKRSPKTSRPASCPS